MARAPCGRGRARNRRRSAGRAAQGAGEGCATAHGGEAHPDVALRRVEARQGAPAAAHRGDEAVLRRKLLRPASSSRKKAGHRGGPQRARRQGARVAVAGTRARD